VLKSAALLGVVLVTVGCGLVEKSAWPQPRPQPVTPKPLERHLVYEKLGHRGVWIADVDGSHARLLVRGGRAPVISPDGRWVVYVSCDPKDELSCKGTFVISTSGGKPRKLSSDLNSGPPGAGAGAWFPDSKRILVSRGGPEEQALISIDLASGKESKLAEDSYGSWSFSPDGTQIVYVGTGPGRHRSSGLESTDLFVVDSTGGEPKQITHTGDGVNPVWGPKSIAFARLFPDRQWGRGEIWQVQPDGSGLQTITGPLPKPYRSENGGDAKDGVIPVAWSEDGRALLGGFLWSSVIPIAVDPKSGEIRDLGHLKGNFPYAVAISRDGRAALAYTYPPIGGYSDDSATVLIVPYAGGKEKIVARGAGSPSWNR
jgi:hypothetical protein